MLIHPYKLPVDPGSGLLSGFSFDVIFSLDILDLDMYLRHHSLKRIFRLLLECIFLILDFESHSIIWLVRVTTSR